MWKVQFLTASGHVWRTYYADEAQARKIADSMAQKNGWKVKSMVREW
jgi:hypothetical protein